MSGTNLSYPTPKEQAEWEGRKAGIAMREQDWPRVRYHMDWFRQFLRLEPKETRSELQKVFDDAYKREQPCRSG